MKGTFTCALVLTAVVGVSSSAAAAPVWTVQKKTGDAWLNVVEVVGKGNTWFFGDEPIFDDSLESRRPVVAYHWNGRKITKVPLPKEIRWGFVDGADFASADDGWAVGMGSGFDVFVLRWNGRTWKRERVRLPSSHAGLYQIAPGGRGGVWATGGTGTHYETEDAPNNPLLYHRLPDGTWRTHTILTHGKPR